MKDNEITDTAAIRAKLLHLWHQIDQRQISASEARLHISIARAILETLKVEIAAAHLNQAQIPSVRVTGAVPLSKKGLPAN